MNFVMPSLEVYMDEKLLSDYSDLILNQCTLLLRRCDRMKDITTNKNTGLDGLHEWHQHQFCHTFLSASLVCFFSQCFKINDFVSFQDILILTLFIYTHYKKKGYVHLLVFAKGKIQVNKRFTHM